MTKKRLPYLLAASLMFTGGMTTTMAHAKTPYDGVWLFDDTPARPGVTMAEISSKGDKISGRITTLWYGPVEMQNARIENGKLLFEARNINDKANPTRQWSLSLAGGKVHLNGQIWFNEVLVSGERGSAKDAAQRAFKFSPMPQTGAPIELKIAATPPMGWSSWNKFAEHIDDKTIRAMADAMVEKGLKDAGYLYINIDDGWQGERDANGVLQPNEKFPDMKALTAYVHSKGLKIGIYSSQGPKTCAGYLGSYGHVEQDAKTFAEWGFDYLKYDLCSGEWFYDTAETVKASYYEMGKALQATGREFIYSLCQYGRFDVGSWGRAVGGQLWRTTGDITDDYETMAKIGFDKNGNPEYTGPHGFNDPDMLEVGNGGMTADEYRTHMSLWAMSAAPLMMGHDLRETSAETLDILTNKAVIAVDQDALGIQGKAVRKAGDVEIWRKPLADGRVAVALFNRGTKPASTQLSASDTGLASVTKAENLWKGKIAGKNGLGEYSLPAHGVEMLILSGR